MCPQIHLAAGELDNRGSVLGEREHHPVAGGELHRTGGRTDTERRGG